jgi:hypothetical protein
MFIVIELIPNLSADLSAEGMTGSLISGTLQNIHCILSKKRILQNYKSIFNELHFNNAKV